MAQSNTEQELVADIKGLRYLVAKLAVSGWSRRLQRLNDRIASRQAELVKVRAKAGRSA